MSYVTTEPEMLAAAAGSLSGIGDAMTVGTTAAAAPTTGVVPPAVDPVSILAASHFATHGQLFQSVSAQAAAVHQQIVATLSGNAAAYAAAEAVNATTTG